MRMIMMGLLAFGSMASLANGQDAAKKSPLIVFVCGDHEYGGEQTLPILAKAMEQRYGVRTKLLTAQPDQNAETNIPNLEALSEADLAVFFLRWRRLPADQIAHIDAYLKSGRPVAGFRTSTHAFNYPKGHELEKWNGFGRFALGGPPGWGNGHTHYGHQSSTDVAVDPASAGHPVLTGIDKPFHVRSWLYHVLPNYPPASAKRLLTGKAVDAKPDAADNPVAWTCVNDFGGRVFMTTMGHPEDFDVEPFQRLVVNGLLWAAGSKPPEHWEGPIKFGIPYRGMVKSKKP